MMRQFVVWMPRSDGGKRRLFFKSFHNGWDFFYGFSVFVKELP